MAEIREEGLRSREAEDNTAQDYHTSATMVRQKMESQGWIQCLKDTGKLCDFGYPQAGNGNKPKSHNWPEKVPYGFCSPVLKKK